MYDPDNPQSQDALLNRVFRTRQVSLDKLLSAIEHWEADYRLHVERSTEALSESQRRMCLHGLVPDELLDHLEMNATRLGTYQQTKMEIERYVEARKSRMSATGSGGATPMELDPLLKDTKWYNCGEGRIAAHCKEQKKPPPKAAGATP